MLKTLIRIRLLSLLSVLTGAGRKKKKQKPLSLIGFALLMIFSFSSIGFLFWHVFDVLATPLKKFGFGWVLFMLAGVLAFALMFIGGIFLAKSQLYEARDNELLLSMPVRPINILLSRLFMLWLVAAASGLPVVIPCILCWPGRISAFGWFAAAALYLVLLPLFCITISALVGWVIHRIAAYFGHKPIVEVLLWMLFFGGYIYLSFSMNYILEDLRENPLKLLTVFGSSGPLTWLGKAVVPGRPDALGKIAAIVLPLFAVTCWLLSRTFIRTATFRAATAKKRYVEKSARVLPIPAVLLQRELRRLWASPAYLFNAGIGVVMALLGAGVLFVKAGAIRAFLSEPDVEHIAHLLRLISLPAVCMLASMIFFTAPSISIEGKNLWISKSLPVDAREILRAKLRLQLLLSVPAILLLSAAVAVALRTEGFLLALLLILPALFCLLIGLVGLVMNLRFPNFDWINETQAVKSGASVLLTMLIGFLLVAVPVVFCVIFGDRVRPEIVSAVYGVLTVLASIFLYRWVMSRGAEIYRDL